MGGAAEIGWRDVAGCVGLIKARRDVLSRQSAVGSRQPQQSSTRLALLDRRSPVAPSAGLASTYPPPICDSNRCTKRLFGASSSAFSRLAFAAVVSLLANCA